MTLANSQEDKPAAPLLQVWSLAGELALVIVIPLLVLILIGIRLDRWAGTTPLFIIIGLLVSFSVSIIAIARKIKRLN
ncbi:MAG: hypothetical protein A3I08_01225 [Candidatus Andersenbacteria bacterium RIFCSPLOWO2_02_FULL_46_11]|nr:MAG: hypothetical protein A3I08_01225 [Candidatus Andersenbacteria bacterium RIFCSPLOWO2_02_FULL_46_11]